MGFTKKRSGTKGKEGEVKKGKVNLSPSQRPYHFMRKSPTPPPAKLATCEEKLAAATYSARKLEHSVGWSRWTGNGSARIYSSALEDLGPKKYWIRKWIRRNRKRRKSST